MTTEPNSPTDSPAPSDGPFHMAVIDLDGTLLRSDHALTKTNARAIKEATHAGVQVVIATARPPRLTEKIYDSLALETAIINYNGALIDDNYYEEFKIHTPLDHTICLDIVKIAREHVPDVVTNVEIMDERFADQPDENLPYKVSIDSGPHFIGPIESFLVTPVTKLMLCTSPPNITKLRDAIFAKHKGKVTLTTSSKYQLQVTHHNANKANAMIHLARHYKVNLKNVMAIGDAPNDFQMIRTAGLGIAMENAWPAVKKHAHDIVPSNDHNGVAIALQRYILSRH